MEQTKTINIKYFDEDVQEIEKIDIGDWIDLRSRKNLEYISGAYFEVPLNVAMQLPEGYEANVVPRSSSFKNHGIVMVNSLAVIDNSYSGNKDEWVMPVYSIRDGEIEKGDRIAQFRIVKQQPPVEFNKVNKLSEKSRGGLGSTGKK